MKKFFLALAFLFLGAQALLASNAVYDYSLTKGTFKMDPSIVTITTSTSFVQNLKLGMPIDYLSFQASYSTPTYAAVLDTAGSHVDATYDTIYTTVTYPPGLSVYLSTYTNIPMTAAPLTLGVTYFIVPYSSSSIRLATTKVNASSGAYIDIITTGTGAFQIIPTGIQSSSYFYVVVQYSDDNLNWYNSTQSSITISGATTPTNILWDFGFTTYKLIRFSVTEGSWGAIKLRLWGYGKSVAP